MQMTTKIKLPNFCFAVIGSLPLAWSPSYASDNKIHDAELRVEHAEVIAPVGGKGMAAGYFVIWNGTDKTRFLSSIKLPSGTNIAVHKTSVQDGIARMLPIKLPYAISPKSELIMRKGSYHTMFPAKKAALTSNETLNLNLEFSDGQTISVDAKILPFGSPVAGDKHGINETQ